MVGVGSAIPLALAVEMDMSMTLTNKQGLDVTSILAEIQRLKAENEALKAKRPAQAFGMKVSEKGALSVYGLGRFPVTLYRQQWERLLANADQVKAFIEANAAKLSVKE